MQHRSLAAFDPLDVLQLIRSENVGPVTFFQLVQRFGSPQEALYALPDLAKRGGMKRKLTIAPRQKVEREAELTEKFGARFLLYGAEDYPALLTEIPDAPPLLTLRGKAVWQRSEMDSSLRAERSNPGPLEQNGTGLPRQREAPPRNDEVRVALGMVGSRNASAAGCALTRKLAKQCGEAGMVVVSGLARGVDTAAHQGALASGTVGVIAGGIDNIYPPENAPLYQEIFAQGAVLSENPFGASPQARSFPSRNRIIAGMCQGLLVVEAAPRSGSLITARCGLDYNREVMAIPGSPLDPRSAGTNNLIKQGATLVEGVDDIVEALASLPQQMPREMAGQMAEPSYAIYDYAENTAESAPEDTLTLLEQKLGTAPIQLDELARETALPIHTLQPALLELELAGRLTRHPGGKVSLLREEGEEPPSLFSL
jgi:DNA processing protein